MNINESFKIKGHYKLELHDAKTDELKEVHEVDNLVPTVMFNAVAQQIAGANTYELEGTYCAVGSGTTSPAVGDTTLETEAARKAIGTRSASGAVATLLAFFNSGEANGTHREVGVFGDGAASEATSSADTGILFSRAAINVTKTVTDTLTVTYTFTMS